MEFKVEIFDCRNLDDRRSPAFRATYEAWKEIWSEEYRLLGKGDLHSDNFTRQDQILSITVDGQVAAISFYQESDLSTPMGQDDSWFADWPKELMDRLGTRDQRILVGSAFTVTKAFRGQKILGISVKDLLAAALTHHLIEYMDYEYMVGSMRNNRGTNKTVYKLGVTPLETVEVNGEPTDLVVFEVSKLPPLADEVKFLLQRAWVSKAWFPKKKKVAKAA